MTQAAVNTANPPAVLHDIDWRTYSRLLRAFDGRRRLRLTYDRGTLEIMSPLLAHEAPSNLLGALIAALALEHHMQCMFGGSVTLRRRRRRRGLEPDRCFWIANAARMLGKQELDLRTDPPPDLAVEVDVTHSSLDRMSIYAALGVPEVWRHSAEGLSFNVLEANRYQARTHSNAFPRLTPADLVPFLNQQGQTDDLSIVSQFQEWVRQHLIGRPGVIPPLP